jgi:deazaflavin-dependent oxidoreductase (nitroreductase family)
MNVGGPGVTASMSWTQAHIDEFRANGGRLGGGFEGRPVLLLTTTGAKTARPHTTPTMYLLEDGRLYVFASKGGAPTHPDWYWNLLANPTVTVELGTERFHATARSLADGERDRVYARQSELYPQFAGYQTKTDRTIPVVELIRSD